MPLNISHPATNTSDRNIFSEIIEILDRKEFFVWIFFLDGENGL